MSLPPYIYALAVSFVISLTVYYKLNTADSFLKYFPPFLLATLAAELVAIYWASIGRHNLAIYNFFTVFEFCFYGWIINLIIQNAIAKRIILITVGFYAIVAVSNILFFQGMETFHTITYALGCLMIVVFSIYYFLELFRLPRSIRLSSNPAFWICSGLLFFYCCGLPLYGLINYWSGISPLILQNFGQINTILNIFLYSLFTLAFLCIRIRRYTLSQSSV